MELYFPGNPGHGGYYKEYMKALYKGCDGKLPVWCVSHAGHGILPAYTGTDGSYCHEPWIYNYVYTDFVTSVIGSDVLG